MLESQVHQHWAIGLEDQAREGLLRQRGATGDDRGIQFGTCGDGPAVHHQGCASVVQEIPVEAPVAGVPDDTFGLIEVGPDLRVRAVPREEPAPRSVHECAGTPVLLDARRGDGLVGEAVGRLQPPGHQLFVARDGQHRTPQHGAQAAEGQKALAPSGELRVPATEVPVVQRRQQHLRDPIQPSTVLAPVHGDPDLG